MVSCEGSAPTQAQGVATVCEASKLLLDFTTPEAEPSIAIRFSDVQIHPRARVLSAAIRLRALTTRSNTGDATFRLRVVDHYSASPPAADPGGAFGAMEHLPTSRVFFAGVEPVEWVVPSWQAQGDVVSADVAPLLQHLVDQVWVQV